MNTNNETVEAVAKAIFDARELDLDQEGDEWNEIPDDWQEEWRALAQAALDAMGLPSREQVAEAIGKAANPTQVGFGVVSITAATDAILALLSTPQNVTESETLRDVAGAPSTVGTVEAQTVVYEWLTRRADEMHTGTPDETTTVQALLRELSALTPATTRDVGAEEVARIKAETLVEAADAMTCMHEGPCSVAWDDTCNRPMDALKVLAWLRDRAASAKGDGK